MRKALGLTLFVLLVGITAANAQVPPTPTLVSPAAGATGVSTTPTLTWNTVATALTYEAEVSTSATFATTVFDSATITAGTVTLTTALAAGTLFRWRVRAANATGTSAWSTARTFTTANTGVAPGTPTLTAPANGATGQSLTPTLTWTAAAGGGTATAFEFQVATNATFTTVVLDSTVSAGTVTLTNNPLTASTTYYWRVNASNAGGTSAFSAARNFTTGTGIPATPVLTAPANGATAVALTPTFTWGTVAQATAYTLEVSTVATFVTLVADTSVTVATLTLGNALTASTTYYWRVNAYDVVGASAYSAARNFTTGTGAPLTPTLTAPANAATNVSLTPTLTWNTQAIATSYTVEVSTSAAFATFVVDSTVTAGTFILTTPLTATTVYYWRVNASDALGTSAFSAARTFTTGLGVPATPTLLTPAAGATGLVLTPTFTWNTQAVATSYTIVVSTSAAFTTLVVDDTVTAGTVTLVSPLTANTNYYWRVDASDVYGASAYSGARTFTTGTGAPPPPTLLTPANLATGVAVIPTLTWSTVATATSYTIVVSTSAAFATLAADTTVTAATVTLGNLLIGTTVYYWRVNATNAIGTGAYSASFSFTTGVGAPATPTLLTPANAAVNVALIPTMTWGTVARATSYTVEVSANAIFTTLVADTTVTAGTVTLGKSLTASTTYYWRVDATGALGTSAYSAAFSFTTAGPPIAPTLLTPANAAVNVALMPTMTWSTVAAATSYTVEVSTSTAFATFVADTAVTAGTVTIDNMLLAGTTYYWRVNASNTLGASAWSAAWSFTSATVPPVPTLTSPASGATGVSLIPTMTWGTVATATSYTVELGGNGAFTTIFLDSTLTATTVTLSFPLSQNSTYFWRVSATNAVGTSVWSTAISFTTGTTVGVIPRANYTASSAGLRGVAEIYLSNGARVMERSFDASVAKGQVLSAMSRSLARGFYIYRLRVNSQIVESGPIVVK